MSKPDSKLDYKQAGVDVDAGDKLVDWLQSSAEKKGPHHDKVVSGIGGFAALFRADFARYKKPLLVSSTDGVGTKVLVGSQFKKFRGLGQDLVAMCVNDLLCCGADPLFFLDYYASGKLIPEHAQEFLTGVREACATSDCALIGGETAEMPGVYQNDDFDCAGFSVGVVDETQMLGPHRVLPGDRVLGVSSSGFHSNGFSLLRKVFADDLEKWSEILLRPTALYTPLMKKVRGHVSAAANITGGGMENIPRVMPKGTHLHLLDWAWPKEFVEVQDRTGLSRSEMLKTLNCGIGFVLIVPKQNVNLVTQEIENCQFKSMDLGKIDALNDKESEAHVVYD